jgi:hypothetical protein
MLHGILDGLAGVFACSMILAGPVLFLWFVFHRPSRTLPPERRGFEVILPPRMMPGDIEKKEE